MSERGKPIKNDNLWEQQVFETTNDETRKLWKKMSYCQQKF